MNEAVAATGRQTSSGEQESHGRARNLAGIVVFETQGRGSVYAHSVMLPDDRGHIVTEQRHEDSMHLDRCDIGACIDLMLDDHGRVVEAVRTAVPALRKFLKCLVPRMRSSGRLIYVGAGTSGRLGVLDASECPPTFQSDPNQIIGIIAGGDRALRVSSEDMEDNPNGAEPDLSQLHLSDKDTVLGIAAGGTTPFVLGAIRIAAMGNALTGLITCAPPAGPVDSCDHLIVLETGPEVLTGSTRLKAGSATKLALNIITTTLFVQLGKTYSNLMVDLRASNAKLTDRAIRILIELCPHLDRAAAATRLEAAEGSLKAAVVMERLDCPLGEARARLDCAAGSLRIAMQP